MTKSILYATLVAVPLIAVVVRAQSADSQPPTPAVTIVPSAAPVPATAVYASPNVPVAPVPAKPYGAPPTWDLKVAAPPPVMNAPSQPFNIYVPSSGPIRKLYDEKTDKLINADRMLSGELADLTNHYKTLDEATVRLLDSERELPLKINELVATYKGLDETQSPDVVNQIRQLVAQQFDVRQQLRDKELEDLKSRLDQLRALQDQRRQQSDRIIDDRVQQLLRDADGLGWGDAGPGGNAFYFQSTGAAPTIMPLPARAPAWNGQPTADVLLRANARQDQARASRDAGRKAAEKAQQAAQRAIEKAMQTQGLSKEALDEIRRDAMTVAEQARNEVREATEEARREMVEAAREAQRERLEAADDPEREAARAAQKARQDAEKAQQDAAEK